MKNARLVFHPSGHIDLNAEVEEQKRQIEFFGPEAGEFLELIEGEEGQEHQICEGE